MSSRPSAYWARSRISRANDKALRNQSLPEALTPLRGCLPDVRLRLQALPHHSPALDDRPDIPRITEVDAMRQAHVVRAGRHQPVVDPVETKVALLRDRRVFVDDDRVVWARPGTQIAARAIVRVHHHDPVTAERDCVGRANLHARGSF